MWKEVEAKTGTVITAAFALLCAGMFGLFFGWAGAAIGLLIGAVVGALIAEAVSRLIRFQ